MWFREFTEYLAETLSTEACVENPSMFRIDTPHGSVVFLTHVDDMLFAGRPLALDDVLSALNDKYTLHVDRIHEEGDELTFLKRVHRLLAGGRLGIQAHPKHIERLEQMLCISHVRPRKTPVPVGALPTDVVTDSLNEEEAHVFRSAVGVMLYLSHDICEAQYGSTCLAPPKELKSF